MCIFFVMEFNRTTLAQATSYVRMRRTMVSPMMDNQRELIRHEKKLRGEKAEIPKGWTGNL